MGFRPPPCTTSATSTASQPLVTVATHASSPAAPMATLLTTPSTELYSGQDPHSAITLPPFQSLVQQVEALAQSVGGQSGPSCHSSGSSPTLPTTTASTRLGNLDLPQRISTFDMATWRTSRERRPHSLMVSSSAASETVADTFLKFSLDSPSLPHSSTAPHTAAFLASSPLSSLPFSQKPDLVDVQHWPESHQSASRLQSHAPPLWLQERCPSSHRPNLDTFTVRRSWQQPVTAQSEATSPTSNTMSINRRSPVVDNEGRYVYSPALEVQQHHNKSAGFGESNPAAELSAFESVSPVSHSATGSTLLPSSSGPRSPTLAPGSAFTSTVGFNTELQVATGRRLSSTYLRSAPLPVTSVSTISSPLASPTSGFVMSPLIPQRSPPGPRAMPLPPAKPHKGTRTALPSSSGSGNVRSGTTRAKLYVPKACINCRQSKVACETRRPCQRCVRMNKADTCVDAVSKRRGRPGGSQLSSASSGKGSSVKLKSVTKPPNTDASEYQSLVTVVANTQGNTQMQAPGNTTPADSHVTRDSEEMAPAVPQRTVPPRATNYRFRLYMDQRNEQPWSRQMDEDGFVHYLRMPTTTPGTSLADVQTPSSTTTHSAQGRSVFAVGPGPTGSQGQPPQSSSSVTTNRSRDKHSRPE